MRQPGASSAARRQPIRRASATETFLHRGVRLEQPIVGSFRLADPEQARNAFAHSVALGLSTHPRRLSCRYLYDEHGSELFDRITEQPEYYLTRTEAALLAMHAAEIQEITGRTTLVELGSGTSAKTRHLLDAWAGNGHDATYVAVDICPAVVAQSCEALAREYDRLTVRGIAGSYEQAMPLLSAFSPLTLAFLGSTIGNFDDAEMADFLRRLHRSLTPGDNLLLGIDLAKDPATLEAAYNDAAGVSAEFTRNIFARMNRELGTGLDIEQIEHVAYYSSAQEQIEIFARFNREQHVELPGLGRSFRIAPGEMIQTEISRKFRVDDMVDRLTRHGFAVARTFVDPESRFALLLLQLERSASAPDAIRQKAEHRLDEARARTRDLIYPLDEEQLRRQHSELMSPIVWDLAHIANFEEQWVSRASPAHSIEDRGRAARDALYEATAHPRASRGGLVLPGRDACLAYLSKVRTRTRAAVRAADVASTDPLLANAYIYSMLAQHEAQHNETVLQTIQMIEGLRYEPHLRREPRAAARHLEPAMVTIPAGSFLIGTNERHAAYDNERPAHVVDLERFRIDMAPVTNGEYASFIEDGGYRRRELWCEDGWRWLETARIERPAQWRRLDDGSTAELAFGRLEPLDPRRPVIHVCWYEADAYARWAGKRLPTELEWETAASCDLERGVARTYPWGEEPPSPEHANLDQRAFAPAQVGAYPAGRSYFGCEQMIGCVWEWTSSDFEPYPSFQSFPYREYSEIHFGRGYKVLRGGSWATRPIAIRNTFRNWDLPQRRQIFAGFRCAMEG